MAWADFASSVIDDFLADARALARAVARRHLNGRGAVAAAGAKVGDVAIPACWTVSASYYVIAPAEASSNLSRYDGVRCDLRIDADDVTQMNAKTRAAGFGAEVKRRIMLGTYALSAGYYDAYYAQAQRVRTLDCGAPLAGVPRDFDVLIGPTTPGVAFRFGEKEDPLSMYLSDLFTIPSNLAGHPAMSVPFALGEDDLPIGVQILAPSTLGEVAMFQVAAALEAAAPRRASQLLRGVPSEWCAK